MNGPRYVVREIEGKMSSGDGRNSNFGLSVWVADEAHYGREVKVWRTEDLGGMWTQRAREKIRGEAHRLAAELNDLDEARVEGVA